MIAASYPHSTRDHLMPGLRPHFGPSNPLWKYLDLYHDYTARLGYMLSRGEPSVSTAVYYDVRSVWVGGEARKVPVKRLRSIEALLYPGEAAIPSDAPILSIELATSRMRSMNTTKLLRSLASIKVKDESGNNIYLVPQ